MKNIIDSAWPPGKVFSINVMSKTDSGASELFLFMNGHTNEIKSSDIEITSIGNSDFINHINHYRNMIATITSEMMNYSIDQLEAAKRISSLLALIGNPVSAEDKSISRRVEEYNANFGMEILTLPDGYFFRRDTDDSDSKEQSDNYTEAKEDLAVHGLELSDPLVEHDCISGNVVLIN